MVKIKIMKPGTAVAVDFEEAEAEEMFKKIASTLLGMKGKEPVNVSQSEGRTVPASVNPPLATEDKELPDPAPEPDPTPMRDAPHCHSGFLYIKCGHCGTGRAFCVKQPTEYSKCCECGGKTYFTEPLRPLYLNCECGSKARYLTNMTDEMFDIRCINCKAPVAVKYNRKRNCYETIR